MVLIETKKILTLNFGHKREYAKGVTSTSPRLPRQRLPGVNVCIKTFNPKGVATAPVRAVAQLFQS